MSGWIQKCPIAFRAAMLATTIILCMLPAVDVFPSDEINTITFDEPVHFSAPNGSDVLAPAGIYEVEVGEPGLRLISETGENKRFFLVDAVIADIDMDAAEPVALGVRLREDEYHILLLMPGRKVHEAVGFSSGIRVRGTVYNSLTPAQIKAALRTKRISSP